MGVPKKQGLFFGSPSNKDHNISGSVLEPCVFAGSSQMFQARPQEQGLGGHCRNQHSWNQGPRLLGEFLEKVDRWLSKSWSLFGSPEYLGLKRGTIILTTTHMLFGFSGSIMRAQKPKKNDAAEQPRVCGDTYSGPLGY